MTGAVEKAELNNARSASSPLGVPVLVLMTALSTLGLLSVNLYLPSLPTLISDLKTTTANGQLTLSIFLVSFAIGQLVSGPISDRIGRRPVLLSGLALYAVASLACAVPAGVDWLLAMRALQGLGASVGWVVTRAMLRDQFAGENLMRSIVFINTFTAVVPGFSPLIGGVIETTLGWQTNFAAMALVACICGGIVWARIGETNLNPSPGLLVSSILAGYGRLLANRAFISPALVTALSLGGLYGFLAASPALFIERIGLSPEFYGAVSTVTVIGVFAGGTLTPRMAKRYGEGKTLIAGIACMIAGSAAMGLFFLSDRIGVVQVIGSMMVFLFGMAIATGLATAAALRPFAMDAGRASALIGFLQMAGAALGTLLCAYLPLPYPFAMPITMGSFALLAMGLALSSARRSGS